MAAGSDHKPLASSDLSMPPSEVSREPPPPAPTPATLELPTAGAGPSTRAGFQQELEAVEAGLLSTCGSAGRSDEVAAADAVDGSEDSLADLQLQAARKLRQLLSTNRELLIQEVLERNWVPLLLGWLQLHQRPAVQVEALWALTNIAAGTAEHTHVLIKHGAVPTLVSLLNSPNEEVLEQAMWVLGNLAGAGANARDSVLSAGALRPLVASLSRSNCSLSMLRIGSWTLSNLCDGQPRPVVDIHVVLPVLAKLLQNTDAEVLSHTCWALSHLCDGPSSHIKAVVEADVCWRLVQLLMHRSWRVTKPALRTIGNIVCAEDETDYTQHIIEAGAVPCLRQLIAHNNREIQKEACWTLSNIAAGTIEQIQTVLDSGAVPSLVKLASAADTDAEVKNEACWVVLNATSCGSDLQIEYLVKEGCVAVLGELLSETSMVMMALEGLERILQVGDEEAKRITGTNPYAALLSTSRIEELEAHKSSAIAKRASRIWKQHFVTCAICNSSYSKHSTEARFCDECKCHVCVNCNCTVFHLSYQEEFWKEMTDKEASQKQAAADSKRARKKKKKNKLKDRKKEDRSTGSAGGGKKGKEDGSGSEEAVLPGEDDGPSASPPRKDAAFQASPSLALSKLPVTNGAWSGASVDEGGRDAAVGAATKRRTKRSASGQTVVDSAGGIDGGTGRRSSARGGAGLEDQVSPVGRRKRGVAGGTNGANSTKIAKPVVTNGWTDGADAGGGGGGGLDNHRQRSSDHRHLHHHRRRHHQDDDHNQRQNSMPEQSPPPSPQPPAAPQEQPPPNQPRVNGKRKDQGPGVVTENDHLVSFLQETGSILALAQLLDAGAEEDEEEQEQEQWHLMPGAGDTDIAPQEDKAGAPSLAQ